MKITSIAVLAILPVMFGCTSTTVKTYSTDFSVCPVKTENVGKMITEPDGTQSEIKQQYEFKATVTETTQSTSGENVSRVIASPKVTTSVGSEAKVSVGEGAQTKDGVVRHGTQLEVSSEDQGTQFTAYLKATIQRGDDEPVSCSQTITVQK